MHVGGCCSQSIPLELVHFFGLLAVSGQRTSWLLGGICRESLAWAHRADGQTFHPPRAYQFTPLMYPLK